MLLLFLNEQINASNHNVIKHPSFDPTNLQTLDANFDRCLQSFFGQIQRICQKAMTNKFFFLK